MNGFFFAILLYIGMTKVSSQYYPPHPNGYRYGFTPYPTPTPVDGRHHYFVEIPYRNYYSYPPFYSDSREEPSVRDREAMVAFRSQLDASKEQGTQQERALAFNSGPYLTLTYSTSTTTSIKTVLITCTTSTATLTTCVAGRKRRNVPGSLRGVLHNDENLDDEQEIFLTSPDSESLATRAEGQSRNHKLEPSAYFIIPRGNVNQGRQLGSFINVVVGTTTVSTTTTSTVTKTALCSSVTSYQLCGATG